VARILDNDCVLDKIERRSVTRQNLKGLFAWLWTGNPDKIPRVSEYTMHNRPDVPRQCRELPEGTPTEEGKEGSTVTVLIHLDVTQDYTPLSPSSSPGGECRAWPVVLGYSGWHWGVRDGHREPRPRPPTICSGDSSSGGRGDDGGDGTGSGRHRRGRRQSGHKRFWQNMRDHTQCHDASAWAPESSRYRRRDTAPPATLL
jgi:hypothetical protein